MVLERLQQSSSKASHRQFIFFVQCVEQKRTKNKQIPPSTQMSWSEESPPPGTLYSDSGTHLKKFFQHVHWQHKNSLKREPKKKKGSMDIDKCTCLCKMYYILLSFSCREGGFCLSFQYGGHEVTRALDFLQD